jgi:hypothetical protein
LVTHGIFLCKSVAKPFARFDFLFSAGISLPLAIQFHLNALPQIKKRANMIMSALLSLPNL